jgi:imidazole glycerol phosphate synthase subunit HisF
MGRRVLGNFMRMVRNGETGRARDARQTRHPCLDVANGRVVKGTQIRQSHRRRRPCGACRALRAGGRRRDSFLDITAPEGREGRSWRSCAERPAASSCR